MPCGFLGVSYGYWIACLPVPPCLIRLILTRHAAHDVIAHRPAHRLALRLLIAPRPVIRHDRRGGVLVRSVPVSSVCHGSLFRRIPWADDVALSVVLASNAMSFMSARRDIIRPRFSSHYSSPRLLAARRPMPINTVGVSVSRRLTTGMAAAAPIYSAIQSVPSVPLPSAPPNRHGERGERRGGFSVLGACVRSACPFNCVGVGDGAIAFIVWVLLIACPSSCDCRAIPRRSMWVVIGSGLDQARSFPRLLRIPCGFVFFSSIAPSRLPRAVSSAPSHLIRPVPLLASSSSSR